MNSDSGPDLFLEEYKCGVLVSIRFIVWPK